MQLSIDPERVEGWYRVEAVTRRLKGVAHVRARKAAAPSSPASPGGGLFAGLLGGGKAPAGGWEIEALRVEFDREALAAADARRLALSAAGGYRRVDELDAAAAAAAAGDAHATDAQGHAVVVITAV